MGIIIQVNVSGVFTRKGKYINNYDRLKNIKFIYYIYYIELFIQIYIYYLFITININNIMMHKFDSNPDAMHKKILFNKINFDYLMFQDILMF